jgi:DNA polymerase IV
MSELASDFAPDLRVLMLDFNAYFASVEQQLNPALRGVPLGIVPMKAETTSCIAASYEAKAYGIKTGTRVSEARKLCPNIQFVVAKHAKYVTMHHQAVAIVNRHIPVDAVLSIDEMCATLSPRWQTERAATQLARELKAALIKELGVCMRTSIGIASNRFLAKTASNLQKPDGLVLLRAAQLPQALYHLPLEALNGIGRNMALRLRSYGIDDVPALYQQTRQQLRTVWGGIGGQIFWDKLHGLETHETVADTQSIGHSHVMPPHERHREAACQVLDRLLQKASMRLRKAQFVSTHLSVYVGYVTQKNTPQNTLQKRLYWQAETHHQATDDTRVLLYALHQLLRAWQPIPRKDVPLKVGLVLHGLMPKTQVTADLFADPIETAHSGQLNHVRDQMNVKYGKNTLYFASSHEALDSAPMRIAFNRIPDLDTES